MLITVHNLYFVAELNSGNDELVTDVGTATVSQNLTSLQLSQTGNIST